MTAALKSHELAEPLARQSLRVQRLVRRIERLSEIADKKAATIGGWKKSRPTRRGLWFQAVWQSCGYFHIQRFPVNSMVKYLRAQNDRLWSGANAYWLGPFPKSVESETWTHHVNPPNDALCSPGVGAVEAHKKL